MTAATLRALAARCMEAGAGDRELDAEIAVESGVVPAGYERFNRLWTEFCWRHTDDKQAPLWLPPAFTSRFDAALSLVPLDDGDGPWLPHIDSENGRTGLRWGALLAHCVYDATEVCHAPTPALALTAAALLARAAVMEAGE